MASLLKGKACSGRDAIRDRFIYVAYEIGFFDQTYFNKQVKRHFFVIPGSYHKQESTAVECGYRLQQN
jgi:AraC-like DNA-binding protein